MPQPLPLLPTTVVGSYPQPAWLMDHDALRARLVPRVRAPELWRVPEPFLAQAQDDATILAIRDMERAGIDIITDGEIRRESYSNHFAQCAGRHRPRQPGRGHRPHRQADRGAARHRADAAGARRWRCATSPSPAPTPTAR